MTTKTNPWLTYYIIFVITVCTIPVSLFYHSWHSHKSGTLKNESNKKLKLCLVKVPHKSRLCKLLENSGLQVLFVNCRKKLNLYYLHLLLGKLRLGPFYRYRWKQGWSWLCFGTTLLHYENHIVFTRDFD